METPEKTEQNSGNVLVPLKNAEEVVRAIGLVFSNTYLYGPQHGVTKKAMNDCYSVLSSALEAIGEINFQIAEDSLMVNGETIELKNPLVRMFVTRLMDIDVNNFSLIKGLSREKFEQLMEIMNAKPEELRQLGGFATFASSVGINEIKVRKVVVKQIDEDAEEVVSREKLDEQQEIVEKAKSVETILAFLKGEIEGDDPSVQKGLETAAPDAKKLGEFILRAAEIRQAANPMGGESFGDIVVGCLRRFHEALSKTSLVKTQKGRKLLSKNFMLLEKEVLDKMREMAGEIKPADEAAVKEVIEEITDDLAVDGLVSEYIKKRDAISSSEKRILRYIKNKGLDKLEQTELKERLMACGLSEEGWQELLVKSGMSGVETEGGTGEGVGRSGGGSGSDVLQNMASFAAIGNIAVLLSTLEKKVEEARQKGQPPKIDDIAADVANDIKGTTQATENKINELGKELKSDADIVDRLEKEAMAEGVGIHMPRRKLLKMLAEIGQELCQPLSVVNCSLEMIMTPTIGPLNPQQLSLVELAHTSTERLRVLVEDLKTICGMPDTMSPDSEITSALYNKDTKGG